MEAVISNAKSRMKKSINALEKEFNTIRTGRASVALFDKIKIDAYGQATLLSQAATISIPEARLVIIQPWDKGLLSEIQKAIQKSELSVNPNNDGKVIRINIPPLTEERRKELVKVAKSNAEQNKVSIRNIRRDANDELKRLNKTGDISEDDEKVATLRIQKLTDTFIKEIGEILKIKENEIMEI